MPIKASFLLLLFAVSAAAMSPKPTARASGARTTESFDHDWRFAVGDAPGADKPDFNDSAWRALDLPHDWSIEGPFDQNNPTRGSGAFLPSGIGWYRKTFTLPPAAQSRRVFVEFDGVMQNSDVWINGKHLGHRPYGYVSFRYELTGHVHFGADARNVLTVRADTSQQPASRWYSGAGIYRHVRLVTVDAVHLEPWSTFVTTKNLVIPLGDRSPDQKPVADLHVETRVVNQASAAHDVAVQFAVLDQANKTVAKITAKAKPVAPGQSVEFAEDIQLVNPWIWTLTEPGLYRLVTTVVDGEKAIDDETVTFGVRQFRFDPATGFSLNGRKLKLLGVCLHHDGGAFGAAVPLAVWEQRLATLRTLGVNAIRTAHNPPDPGFLDLCDRMGFLVMDELFDCWTVGKNPYDYHLFFKEWSKIDTRDTVRRDRNHPSVVLYSAGNEIHDTPQEALAKGILQELVTVFHENDPTRPVTQGLFRPNVSHDYTNGLADLLDVVGTNYRDGELLAAWEANRARKIVDTEQQHDRRMWLLLRDNPALSGQFLWTGVDYLGEARTWPRIGSSTGLIDRTGFVKVLGRERQSWWSDRPMVAIVRRVAPEATSQYDPGYEPANTVSVTRRPPTAFADWSPGERNAHDENVEAYSNCESVELFLNGKSLGALPLNANAAARTWKVPFASGTLRAVGRNAGKDVASEELRTAEAPARIVVAADRPTVSSNWEDVVRITATIVDAKGTPVPMASDVVTFAADGPGAIVAVDDGDNASHEPFQAKQRSAYQGRCVAFVRASAKGGKITIKATAPGLADGVVTLEAR